MASPAIRVIKEGPKVMKEWYFKFDNGREVMKPLLKCWPGKLVDVAKAAGITLKALHDYMQGKVQLSQEEVYRLDNLLGIDLDDRIGEFAAVGPYILVASQKRALEDVYCAISHGGDASPYEIVPNAGPAEPSWRYFVVNTCGEDPSVVMAARGEKVTDIIDDILFNYSGSIAIDRSMYLDVIRTCAAASADPNANVQGMKALLTRHDLTDLRDAMYY